MIFIMPPNEPPISTCYCGSSSPSATPAVMSVESTAVYPQKSKTSVNLDKPYYDRSGSLVGTGLFVTLTKAYLTIRKHVSSENPTATENTKLGDIKSFSYDQNRMVLCVCVSGQGKGGNGGKTGLLSRVWQQQ